MSSVPRAQAADALFAVSGVVVSDAGAPLEGVQVNGYSSSDDGIGSSDSASTAKDGSFTLHLAAGKGSVNAFFEKWRASDSHELSITGNVSGLKLVMKTPPPKTAIVEGTVLGPDGAPFGGALVRIGQGCCYLYDGTTKGAPPPTAAPTPPDASNTTPSSEPTPTGASRPFYYDGDDQQMMTGPDGKFHFATYGGPRQLTVTAKGYAQSTLTVQAEDGKTVTSDVKLEKVPPRDATIHGRVVDAKTGLPIKGVSVSLNNLAWNRYESAMTDASGAFNITTLPGWSMASASFYGDAMPLVLDDAAGGVTADTMPVKVPQPPQKQYYAYVKTLLVKSGDQTLDIKLEPKPDATIALLGYVVDPTAKKGVPDASVSVWDQDTGDWGTATTDATGSYKILVRPGHYTANAYAPGHLQGAAMFVVPEGSGTKRVDIDAPAGEARYAPCDDCYRIMPMEKGAPTIESSRADSLGASSQNAPSAPPGADASKSATFTGSGGGLPAYTPEGAPASGTARSNTVPFAGPLVLLAIAFVAIALRRRR